MNRENAINYIAALFCFACSLSFLWSAKEVVLEFDKDETTGVLDSKGAWRGTQNYYYEVNGRRYSGFSSSFSGMVEYGESIKVTYSPKLPFISRMSESRNTTVQNFIGFSVILLIGLIILRSGLNANKAGERNYFPASGES